MTGPIETLAQNLHNCKG